MTGPLVTALGEAWLLGFLLAATLAVGAVAILAVGLVLGEPWIDELRPALSAAARATPVLALLVLPLPIFAGQLYPWARGEWAAPLLALGFGLPVMLLILLALVVARSRVTAPQAGLALLLLVPGAALVLEDWAFSRDEGWTGSLQGLAMVVGSTGADLSLAILAAMRTVRFEDEARTGLERALLALGIAVLWLVFIQFLTVWAADLPKEAAWYLRRTEGAWLWLGPGVTLPASLAAVALAAVPQWSRRRMAAVCGLLAIQHVTQLVWAVRPDAALAPGAVDGAPHALIDAAVILAMALLVGIALRLAGARRGVAAHA
jgi:hypothetical protein